MVFHYSFNILDVNSKNVIMEWKAHNGPTSQAFFNGDETKIYSVGEDGNIIQWSAHIKGKQLSQWKIPTVNTLKDPKIILSPSEKYFVLDNPSSIFEMDQTSPSFIFCDQNKEILSLSSIAWNESDSICGGLSDSFDIGVFNFSEW